MSILKSTSLIETTIHTIPITNNFYAYKKQIYIDGALNSSTEGIVDEDITSITMEIRHSDYHMYDKTFRERLRTSIEKFKIFQKSEAYIILCPYTHILNNGLAEADLLFVDYHEVLDIQNNQLPMSVHMDYMGKAELNNKKYNLNEALNILRKRSDVHICGDGIKYIPQYNWEENMQKYIECFWIPDEEDWRNVVKIKDAYERMDYILSNIIGIFPK